MFYKKEIQKINEEKLIQQNFAFEKTVDKRIKDIYEKSSTIVNRYPTNTY